MFILQALNEINEFSQHSKPPSQKQKLNYNKSWVCAQVFMDGKDLTFLLGEYHPKVKEKIMVTNKRGQAQSCAFSTL